MMLELNSTLVTSCEELTHWKRLWCWEGFGAGGEGDDRGWDGWMASLTRWMWVWVNSGSWWWTGRPGVLRFMGSQRVGHDWATDLIWSEAVDIQFGWGILQNLDANYSMDSDDCVSGMIVLVPILKHTTLTTNKSFYFFLSSSKTCVHVCFQRHNQRVTRVIGLDKTLPAKGSLGLKKCDWCRVGRTLSN